MLAAEREELCAAQENSIYNNWRLEDVWLDK